MLTHDSAGSGPADLLLVQAALRGDVAAGATLLDRLGCIVKFVWRLNQRLGYQLPAEGQEDVVQAVYAALWPRLRDFTGHNALETWVFGFCRNCLRSEVRRRSLHARTPSLPADQLDQLHPEFEPPEDLLARRERLEALQHELEQLPAEEAEAVRLRHLEGQAFEDIARARGVAASTIKDRCYRALTRIKDRLCRRHVGGEES
ncbi:MAG: sigma-70 family RNA polymerase sigma factor [Planctomycetes bacterium]|nr:sigma-70 family RNA polymerase sigma factor [Planctomycetota bacterium]